MAGRGSFPSLIRYSVVLGQLHSIQSRYVDMDLILMVNNIKQMRRANTFLNDLVMGNLKSHLEIGKESRIDAK